MRCLITLSCVLAFLCTAKADSDGFKIITDSTAAFLQNHTFSSNVKIVGGEEAAPNSFPYQVGLFIKVWNQVEKIFCGGSLITDVFVLTAAHCVDRAVEAEVILGAHYIHEVEPTHKRYRTKVFIIHKGWNPATLIDDIAIVRLPERVQFTAEIQPVRLPKLSDQGKSFSFHTATVSGWGITFDGATAISPVLRYTQSKVTLPLICKVFFFGVPGNTHMCINGHRGRSTCSGDSGGPLVLLDKNGEPVLQGITSFGIGFGCEKGWPQVFTKVSMYLKWIFEHTGIPIQD